MKDRSTRFLLMKGMFRFFNLCHGALNVMGNSEIMLAIFQRAIRYICLYIYMLPVCSTGSERGKEWSYSRFQAPARCLCSHWKNDSSHGTVSDIPLVLSGADAKSINAAKINKSTRAVYSVIFAVKIWKKKIVMIHSVRIYTNYQYNVMNDSVGYI